MSATAQQFERNDCGEFFAFLLFANSGQHLTVVATVAAHMKILSQHKPGETGKIMKNPNLDIGQFVRDLNWVPAVSRGSPSRAPVQNKLEERMNFVETDLGQ
jgi:hypothetical protein